MRSILVVAVVTVLSVSVIWLVDKARVEAEDAACQPSNQGMDAMEVRVIQLLDAQGKLHVVEAHIADDGTERAFGYQFICKQDVDRTAILFVYRKPIRAQFHMNNVKAALDIGFFDGAGRLIDQQLMMPYAEGESTLYSPGQEFQFALEAREGYFSDHNLVVGKTRLVRQSIHD